MRVGEIWEYKGPFKPAKDGKRWTDDPDSSWMMEKVRIVNMHYDCGGFGKGIEFEAINGEPHPMEAIYAMPKEMFLKSYQKVYQ